MGHTDTEVPGRSKRDLHRARYVRSAVSFVVNVMSIVAASAGLGACGEAGTNPPAYPTAGAAWCDRIGLESVEQSQGEDRNAALLMAVYTFNEPGVPAAKHPLRFAAVQNRTRRIEPQKSLEAHADLICGPEFGVRRPVVRHANPSASDPIIPVIPASTLR